MGFVKFLRPEQKGGNCLENEEDAQPQPMVLSEHERKVIEVLRQIEYGEVKVIVQDGVPVRMDEIRKSVKI